MPIKDISYTQMKAGKLTLAENDTALKYSSNPEAFKKIMTEITVSIEPIGIDYYFDDDKEKRMVLRVYVAREKEEISFKFGMSLNNTAVFQNTGDKSIFYIVCARNKVKSGLLYSLLSCIASEYHCPNTFEEFCSEFGYNTDSRKAEKTFYACREQSNKLHTIFTDEDIECLPR